MTSSAERNGDGQATRTRLLEQLRDRLESADELTRAMRCGLERADAARIESATSRLETVLLEYRLLADEFRRTGTAAADGPEDPAFVEALAALERTATRIARSAAIAGGVLARMAAISRALLDTYHNDGAESYLRSGRSSGRGTEGLRLRGQA